jgi:hypothetical protein
MFTPLWLGLPKNPVDCYWDLHDMFANSYFQKTKLAKCKSRERPVGERF